MSPRVSRLPKVVSNAQTRAEDENAQEYRGPVAQWQSGELIISRSPSGSDLGQQAQADRAGRQAAPNLSAELVVPMYALRGRQALRRAR